MNWFKKIILPTLTVLMLAAPKSLWAPTFPVGIDTTSGQQKVNTSATIQDSGSGTFVDTGSVQSISGVKTFTSRIIGGLTKAGQASNCGMSVSGSTFTIAGDDGTALSATNPCVIAIKSNTAGRTTLAYFTANVTFTFGSASDTDGNLFGITDANWSNSMPFFFGVIYDGTTPFFTISRLPLPTSGTASTSLCQKADIDCDGNQDAMLLTTGATLSSWTSKPITQIGWATATYATTGGAWTFTISSTSGFNDEYEKNWFTFPTLQQGANVGFLVNNGGTAPTFTTNQYFYQIDSKGLVNVMVKLLDDGGTDGSGAVSSLMALPYHNIFPSASSFEGYYPIGVSLAATTLPSRALTLGRFFDDISTTTLVYQVSTVSLAAIQHSMFTNGNRDLQYYFTYSAMGRIL